MEGLGVGHLLGPEGRLTRDAARVVVVLYEAAALAGPGVDSVPRVRHRLVRRGADEVNRRALVAVRGPVRRADGPAAAAARAAVRAAGTRGSDCNTPNALKYPSCSTKAPRVLRPGCDKSCGHPGRS
eukprot:scaffold41422_cov63-Phaeocystis_antarctica.AAC.3